ncbi:MAG: hypothetical protein HYT83_03835 [Candidatus Levybacteria bacterium]|nr:hypothetical protein [Candidatus Levybacteria bacterium]
MSLPFLKNNGKLILFILLCVFSLYSSYLYLTVGQKGYDTVLVVLAKQFLTRHIALPVIGLPPRDIADYYKNFYVYFGPLSSILLMPFVFVFGESFPQVSIGVATMIVSFTAVYFIAKKFKFSRLDSLWLSLFFVFSTVLFSASVINITASQVEALGVPFILLAILTYLYKKNPLLIGLFIGFAIMTRLTLALSVIFFFFELLQKRLTIKQFALLLIPIVIALSLLGAYNNRRFHSFFETGYKYSISANDDPISLNRKYGETSIVHIPANLYTFLIMAPTPLLTDHKGGLVLKFPYLKVEPWGVAIWYTSPLFLLLLFKFKKGMYTISASLASVVLSLPVFLWYSIGYAQVGYRYSLDFLPFLFIILISCLAPKLSKAAIVLIIIGVIFNCIYTTSIWENYPLFNIYHRF